MINISDYIILRKMFFKIKVIGKFNKRIYIIHDFAHEICKTSQKPVSNAQDSQEKGRTFHITKYIFFNIIK